MSYRGVRRAVPQVLSRSPQVTPGLSLLAPAVQHKDAGLQQLFIPSTKAPRVPWIHPGTGCPCLDTQIAPK